MRDMPDPHNNNMASPDNNNVMHIQNSMTPTDRKAPISVQAIREPRKLLDQMVKTMPEASSLQKAQGKRRVWQTNS